MISHDQPLPKKTPDLQDQNKILTNKEMRTVTQQLKQIMLSPDCNETKVAKFLLNEVGENKLVAEAVLYKAYSGISKNAYIDPSRISVNQVLNKYQQLCSKKKPLNDTQKAQNIVEDIFNISEKSTKSTKIEDVNSKVKKAFKQEIKERMMSPEYINDYERLMVIQIIGGQTGTVLDKIDDAAAYLHQKQVSLHDANEIILRTTNAMLQKGLIKRANLPEQDKMKAVIRTAYEKEMSAVEPWLQPSIDPSLSTKQMLPLESLKTNPWFIENRKDLVEMEKFDGIVSKLNPKQINISVPDPTIAADYLGSTDAKSRTPSDKGENVPDFYAPMLLPEEWAARHHHPEGGTISPENIAGNLLVMNCGWFNVFPKGVTPEDPSERFQPHLETGSFPLGPVVIGEKVLAEHTLTDSGQPLDAITFRNGKAAIYTSAELKGDPELYKPHKKDKNLVTINGFKILDEGNYILTPKNNNPLMTMPRSGIGITENGSLVICVVSTGDRDKGITAEEFADFFKSMGCVSAINLDNSGSAAMAVVGRQEVLDARAIGTKTTAGSDFAKDRFGKTLEGRKNRPIPLALVISPKATKRRAAEL